MWILQPIVNTVFVNCPSVKTRDMGYEQVAIALPSPCRGSNLVIFSCHWLCSIEIRLCPPKYPPKATDLFGDRTSLLTSKHKCQNTVDVGEKLIPWNSKGKIHLNCMIILTFKNGNGLQN